MAPPKPCLCWPITITAGVNDRIDFKVGVTPWFATVTPGVYDHAAYFDGEPTTSLAIAVANAMIAAYATTWYVIVLPAGRVVIGNSSAFNFTIQWATGPNVARSIGPTLGFAVSDDSVGAALQTSEYQHQNGWYCDDPVTDDSGARPAYERAQTVALSGKVKGITHAARYRRAITLGSLPAWKVWIEDEGVSHPGEALERLLASGWARFRWFPDQAMLSTDPGTDWAIDLDSAKSMPRNRLSAGAALYSVALQFRKYV